MAFEHMPLERPIVFFDIESTGVDPKRDRIIELSMVKVLPNNDREIRTRRFNPTIPIPPSSSEIHGIVDADVANAPLFSSVAAHLFDYLKDCDLGGYNLIVFDVPILQEEFKRCGIDFDVASRKIVDVFVVYKKMCPRDLSEAYAFYCHDSLENAHSAEADILATLAIFEAQLEQYGPGGTGRFPKNVEHFPQNMDELDMFCRSKPSDWVDGNGRFKWMNDEVVIGFGKNKGELLRDIVRKDPSFLRWIMRSDFADDVKKIASDALLNVFPKKEA